METQKTQKSHRSIFKNISEMKNAVGKELGINKSRSVYHRIVNKEGGYSVENDEK